MDEDTKNAVTSSSDIIGEGKEIEMEDAHDKEYVSGQSDESLEVEVAKETLKAPVVSHQNIVMDLLGEQEVPA